MITAKVCTMVCIDIDESAFPVMYIRELGSTKGHTSWTVSHRSRLFSDTFESFNVIYDSAM